MYGSTVVLALLAELAAAQKPQYPPVFPPTPILPSSINYAPQITPNVMDPTAPNAQSVCPGYTASNVKNSSTGLAADLTLAGTACNVYGTEIPDLVLEVQYQSKERLAVRIYPKYLAPSKVSQYILSPHFTSQGVQESNSTAANADLLFEYTNEPSFGFRVARRSTGEVIFDTYGHKLVFENQFLELVTNMVTDYNIYGLAENLRGFRIPNTFNQTFWNAYDLNNDQLLDVNGHTVHPVYLEQRYGNGSVGSARAHGVYARNAHGQDWIMSPSTVSYRTIGGSFDLYFFSGSTPKEVISQYQTGVINTPYIPAYWHLGSNQDVIDLYADQRIQLEAIMNDLDYLQMNRDFTNNPGHYDFAPGKVFLDQLHANGQYYMPILDPNIYVPNPANASDAYPTYARGDEMQAYIRNGNDSWYIGVQWPGFSVFPDFNSPQAHQFWTEEILAFHEIIAFDGFWLDVNDAVSFCTGSCGEGLIHENPIHVPFALPGDPNTSVAVNFMYPEMFAVTNASEAASASAALASQSAAYPIPASLTSTLGRTTPTPGVRNLIYPPYAINNFLNGHTLGAQAIMTNATHNDGPYNSTEYDLHNLYGHQSANATYNALKEVFPGKRPFFVSRSQFAGSGAFSGHWGGDTNSASGDMYFGISQALQNSIAGVPEPYRWATTSEATRRIMNIRYTLLPYTYTLFERAHSVGETVLRALQWEFPDDAQLAAVETQFMSGPALLVTPVLAPLATTVSGVFPGIAQGQIWYDWYTLEKVNAAAGENVTMQAPLIHQPIHIRGGYIIPVQTAGNTTKTSRTNPWSLIVALDQNGDAAGELYEDDGISLVQNATKELEFTFANSTLKTSVSGDYNDGVPLANVTIAGYPSRPSSVVVNGQSRSGSSASNAAPAPSGGNWGWYGEGWHGGSWGKRDTSGVQHTYSNGSLYITGLESSTQGGAWLKDLTITIK
ncbi:hypothetical protein EJ03DRAFT_379015 [Teratosphaeria nubilosa]|uniref:alpha-glucosidase n=1 Tax=Teratosphaeria nubilosa TaxID=161662 RepID=A0A6G1KUM7_9PEZI|nr:hypothetical protein EJ03DRAFT_379015 [Teratosphaeria nubilosa]